MANTPKERIAPMTDSVSANPHMARNAIMANSASTRAMILFAFINN